MKEFDAVLVTPDCVCTFFPEYNAVPLVGILANLAVDGERTRLRGEAGLSGAGRR